MFSNNLRLHAFCVQARRPQALLRMQTCQKPVIFVGSGSLRLWSYYGLIMVSLQWLHVFVIVTIQSTQLFCLTIILSRLPLCCPLNFYSLSPAANQICRISQSIQLKLVLSACGPFSLDKYVIWQMSLWLIGELYIPLKLIDICAGQLCRKLHRITGTSLYVSMLD